MKAIDLFCGAGGLTQGLRRAGWDVVLGIDVDPTVGETYRRNNPGAKFVAADLKSITGDDIRASAGTIPSQELLLAGCAPCQPFSKQRRWQGLGKCSDDTLLLEFGAARKGVATESSTDGKRPRYHFGTGIQFISAFPQDSS